VVITGASGGDTYAQKYQKIRNAFVATLRDTFDYKVEQTFVFAEEEGDGVQKATRENVQRTFGELRKRLAKDDQLLVLLVGHGTVDGGEDAKFNLVGPDLTAAEWADLVKAIPGRLVFVDTTGASFPFLKKIAGRNRVVLTANDSAAQQFETVFPEFSSRPSTRTQRTPTRAAASRSGRHSNTPVPRFSNTFKRRVSWRPSARCSTTPAPALAGKRNRRAPTVRWRESHISSPNQRSNCQPTRGSRCWSAAVQRLNVRSKS
jgi:hypothetical protein